MWWIWALEVNVPWPSAETNVDYNGHTFNLLPQTSENFASIAVQAPIDQSSEVSKAVHRFLSVLSWIDGHGIRTLWSVGNPGWRQPTQRSPYLTQPGIPSRIRSNFDFLPVPKDEPAAKALAFYREAVSSQSPDNKFLQYFRIVELAHGHKGAEHPKFMNELIAKANLRGEAVGSIQVLQAKNLNVGKQVVIYGRHAVAHGDDAIAIDPDIVGERALLHTLMPIIAELANYTIESHFGVPTLRAYYRRHEYEVEGFVAKLSDDVRAAILASAGELPVSIDLPVLTITIGLRSNRYPALTGLSVSEAIVHDGGVSLRAQSPDDLLRALVHFDLVNRQLFLDVERWLQVVDNGSAASSEHAVDVLELTLGLVGNGELHVWDAESDELLGRQNPNLPVNINPSETQRLLAEKIAELRAQAESRKEAQSG
jgi:hypothetical protein